MSFENVFYCMFASTFDMGIKLLLTYFPMFPLASSLDPLPVLARKCPLHSTPLTGWAVKPQRQGHLGGPIAQP